MLPLRRLVPHALLVLVQRGFYRVMPTKGDFGQFHLSGSDFANINLDNSNHSLTHIRICDLF